MSSGAETVTVVERQLPFRPTETMDPPQGPVLMETSYGQNFPEKQGERVQPIRHDKPRQQPEKFDATATYQDDYRTWSLPQRPPQSQPLWLPPQERFQASTTSQETFTAHALSPRDPGYKPDPNFYLSTDPFPQNTESRDNFVPHPTQPIRTFRRNDPVRTPPPKFEASTTSSQAFQGATQPKRQSFRPANEVFLPTEPLASETTFRSDYQPWVVGRRQRREAEKYAGPQGEMDFTTTAKGAYSGCQPAEPRAQPSRRPSNHVLEGAGPMQGQSHYSADFGEWKVAPREPPKPQPGFQPPAEKFAAETTNRTDFRAHELSPPQSKRPEAKPLQSDEPFASSTGYRESFVPHPLEGRAPPDRPSYSQPTVAMATSTTNREDFRGLTAPKRSSKRPDRKAFESEDPFVGDTTSKADFRAWPMGERYRRQPEQYAGPQGDMDLNTTSQIEFKGVQTDKVSGRKPESAHLLDGAGPMETRTHYGADYGEWKSAPREPLVPRPGYQPPAEKFSGTSTTHSEFVAHQTPRLQLRRPDAQPFQSQAPFQAASGYSQDFVSHPVEVRKPRQREGHVRPSEPFLADTTFSRDFTAKYQPKRPSCKPSSQAQQSQEPFDSSTTAQDSFRWTKMEARPRPEPARWERPEGAMELTTVSQAEFPPHPPNPRSLAVRPRSSHILKHEGKVEGSSSYASSFQRWEPQERARPRVQAPYQPSSQPFLGESTSKAQYVAHPQAARAQPLRPAPGSQPLQQQQGHFDSVTTYGQDFQDKSGGGGVPSWLKATPKATPIHTLG